ncbi:protein BZR1-like protein 1-like [Iris pallida]|uniref:Protein BZR1-like protein 1-like n=1 Tax=Iris pallida TaxID=29817 RepID=A0AAX6HW85_IRIPA|nr:protein BZR1-like protein 1-like [Iris pallida]
MSSATLCSMLQPLPALLVEAASSTQRPYQNAMIRCLHCGFWTMGQLPDDSSSFTHLQSHQPGRLKATGCCGSWRRDVGEGARRCRV